MIKRVYFSVRRLLYYYYYIVVFNIKDIKYEKDFIINGFMRIYKSKNGVIKIGKGIKINNGNKYNPIGRQENTSMFIEGTLTIGNNVGMSSINIVCKKKITIGNNVLIGGNTVIYDTDFHSMNYKDWFSSLDTTNTISKEIIIGDNVFIGAHSTVLKGTHIGNNVIIGACSLVTGNIPPNQVWAGNPARFIRNQ